MCCMMHGMDHSEHNAQPGAKEAPRQNESLLDILERRYAVGEINRAQLEEMKGVLGLTDAGPAAAASGEHGRH